MVRSRTAATFERGTSAAFFALGLSETDQEAVMKPIRSFSDSIRAGGVSLNQGMMVLKEILSPPVMGVLGTRVFLDRYIEGSTLEGEERDAAIQTVRRYAHALTEEKVSEANMLAVLDGVVETYTDADGCEQVRFKRNLSDGELKAALAVMQAAVEDAGVPAAVRDVDLSTLIEGAIRKGMEEGRKLDAVAAAQPRRRGG